ncbi:hypothetical protein [Brevundimonas lenta]|uniref:Uncharacterized protein n=1 Tax=Brevundimonas lenta TaxID=424796 RepID=A0A7W6JBP1_9CAUL|nr:hypothetical protein [Brevundimonas lenta]MBB4082165.1 hypothetical protein [Brevundimonas lenta]
MAYDAEPGGDPRGPWCPKCRLPVKKGDPSTKMHFDHDPDGSKGLSGLWHGECARPYWDTITPALEKLKKWSGGF